MGRQQPERPHHAAEAVARDRLSNGIVVSTVRLPRPSLRFETKVFSSGWPERPDADEIETRLATSCDAAMEAHRTLVERYRPVVDVTDPDWVYRLMGLPLRYQPERTTQLMPPGAMVAEQVERAGPAT